MAWATLTKQRSTLTRLNLVGTKRYVQMPKLAAFQWFQQIVCCCSIKEVVMLSTGVCGRLLCSYAIRWLWRTWLWVVGKVEGFPLPLRKFCKVAAEVPWTLLFQSRGITFDRHCTVLAIMTAAAEKWAVLWVHSRLCELPLAEIVAHLQSVIMSTESPRVILCV